MTSTAKEEHMETLRALTARVIETLGFFEKAKNEGAEPGSARYQRTQSKLKNARKAKALHIAHDTGTGAPVPEVLVKKPKAPAKPVTLPVIDAEDTEASVRLVRKTVHGNKHTRTSCPSDDAKRLKPVVSGKTRRRQKSTSLATPVKRPSDSQIASDKKNAEREAFARLADQIRVLSVSPKGFSQVAVTVGAKTQTFYCRSQKNGLVTREGVLLPQVAQN